MHELGLCEGVLDAVRTRAAGRTVAGIRVRCGVRHAVDADAMTQAFGMVAAGTEAAAATVDVVMEPVLVTCRDCGAAGTSGDLLAVCRRCDGVNVDISGGDELILESVRYAADTEG
jgi:hydrogenase nickel incorporation protein HypA/HybF